VKSKKWHEAYAVWPPRRSLRVRIWFIGFGNVFVLEQSEVRGDVPREDVERWRLALHRELEVALVSTSLPENPDYERAPHGCVTGVPAIIDTY